MKGKKKGLYSNLVQFRARKKKKLVQNLTREPQLFRAPLARAPLDPGPGTMYPLNPPLVDPAKIRGLTMKFVAVRILQQWKNLKEYFLKFLPKESNFKSTVANPNCYKRICAALQVP